MLAIFRSALGQVTHYLKLSLLCCFQIRLYTLREKRVSKIDRSSSSSSSSSSSFLNFHNFLNFNFYKTFILLLSFSYQPISNAFYMFVSNFVNKEGY
ncbi:hypothetical protein MSMTP_3025 [Methanosarcina sp. MTP4]|nr:hypothetical protein MSMTP_3025 [Methanosarcina sp. MTP4]